MINYKKIADKFKGEFPCNGCRLCCKGYIVIYPGEKKFLEMRQFPGNFESVDNIICIVDDCSACSLELRKCRPIDCKTYPYAVIKIDDSYILHISKLCPQHDNIPQGFYEEVKYMWEHLLTKKEIVETLEKIPFDDTFNPQLDWVGIEEIKPHEHPELD